MGKPSKELTYERFQVEVEEEERIKNLIYLESSSTTRKNPRLTGDISAAQR